MKSLVPVVLCCSCLLTGCSLLSHFGYYKHQKAEWAPPEEAERVTFPNSFEQGARLNGPTLAALRVAMDDFIPHGSKVTADNQRLAECLSRWDTYDTSVLQVSEELYFVSFLPRLSRCGIDAIVLDAGATYAIDGKGRILDVR
jgi:hypothetical protein